MCVGGGIHARYCGMHCTGGMWWISSTHAQCLCSTRWFGSSHLHCNASAPLPCNVFAPVTHGVAIPHKTYRHLLHSHAVSAPLTRNAGPLTRRWLRMCSSVPPAARSTPRSAYHAGARCNARCSAPSLRQARRACEDVWVCIEVQCVLTTLRYADYSPASVCAYVSNSQSVAHVCLFA